MGNLEQVFERVLSGETVELGIFRVYEDFQYTRKKVEGIPQFKRVIALVYFDEEDDAAPSTEDFDGTLESFVECLDAHDVEAEDDDV